MSRQMVKIEQIEEVLLSTGNHEDPKFQEVLNHLKDMPTARESRLPPPPKGCISLRQASRAYNIPVSTLSDWINKRHWLEIVLQIGNKKYISEAKVGELAKIHHSQRGSGSRAVKKFIEKGEQIR